jgi:septal ring factor EnvC (AmiA/AmiB activator)
MKLALLSLAILSFALWRMGAASEGRAAAVMERLEDEQRSAKSLRTELASVEERLRHAEEEAEQAKTDAVRARRDLTALQRKLEEDERRRQEHAVVARAPAPSDPPPVPGALCAERAGGLCTRWLYPVPYVPPKRSALDIMRE